MHVDGEIALQCNVMTASFKALMSNSRGTSFAEGRLQQECKNTW